MELLRDEPARQKKFFDSILYLHRFDTALARAKKIPYVRFAGDFLLFTPAEIQAEKAHAYAAREFERLGLDIHPDKTLVIRAGCEVSFLGRSLPNPIPNLSH